MKFSLFFEMQISDPTRASERQMFHDCVEQAGFVRCLGFGFLFSSVAFCVLFGGFLGAFLWFVRCLGFGFWAMLGYN